VPLKAQASLLQTKGLPLAVAGQNQPQKQRGVIRAVRVEGAVEVIDVSQQPHAKPRPLQSGQIISDQHTVRSGPQGYAVLLFANGSTVTVYENTELSITRFLQEPFKASTPTLNTLEGEPSTSKTSLALDYGKIVGHVKKLRTEAGSTYDITTPIGIAGIRGTTFAIDIPEGKLPGLFSILDGNAFFIPRVSKNQFIQVGDLSSLLLTDQGAVLSALSSDAASAMQRAAQEGIDGFDRIPARYFEPTSENQPTPPALPTDTPNEAPSTAPDNPSTATPSTPAADTNLPAGDTPALPVPSQGASGGAAPITDPGLILNASPISNVTGSP
jgi:hypothetical protein